MIWSDIDFQPSKRKLRTFAALFFVATSFATWQSNAHGYKALAALLLTSGVMVAAGGLLKPSSVRPLYAGMMMASFPMGWLSSHLLLALVYFTLFTPLAVVFRLLGRDPLHLRIASSSSTYLELRPPPRDHRAYFRPY